MLRLRAPIARAGLVGTEAEGTREALREVVVAVDIAVVAPAEVGAVEVPAAEVAAAAVKAGQSRVDAAFRLRKAASFSSSVLFARLGSVQRF